MISKIEKSVKVSMILGMGAAVGAAIGLAACGKAPAAAAGNVTLQANNLSGSGAASLPFELFNKILGINNAYAAAINGFTAFQMCNDTLVLTDVNGNKVAVNGAPTGTGVGVLSISATATTPTALASLNIAAGTQIKEIDVTSAVSTTLCPSMNGDAVEFTPTGGSMVHITQNTAFKFTYANPVTISGNAQALTLVFGQITQGMINLAQGSGLTNSSIQTVNAGSAQ